jgi:hypothetical protein
MEPIKPSKGLLLFFGITLFTQAVTSLVAGSIFLSPFDSKEITDASMRAISTSTGNAYTSILLHVATAIVIIMLGVAMYRIAGHKNKVMADIALLMYTFEAILLVVGQAFLFGLVEAAQLYTISADYNLLSIGKILLTCREFSGEIAMIPFGIGAFLFYFLLLKAEILPKWLGLYGLITVPLILIGVPLMTFGVNVPFAFLVPYVPFEFFTGIYILIKYRNMKTNE